MPQQNRWMAFVDGTNFLRRASEVLDVKFRPDKPPWPALTFAAALIAPTLRDIGAHCIRKYWFASYSGDEAYEFNYATALRKHGKFEPVLFRKREKREKGVDIALTMEMLVNAFQQNYDGALLVAGDEDYLNLVKEVKRYGPIVDGAFFENGLSKRLRLAFDRFTPFASQDHKHWDRHREKIQDWDS